MCACVRLAKEGGVQGCRGDGVCCDLCSRAWRPRPPGERWPPMRLEAVVGGHRGQHGVVGQGDGAVHGSWAASGPRRPGCSWWPPRPPARRRPTGLPCWRDPSNDVRMGNASNLQQRGLMQNWPQPCRSQPSGQREATPKVFGLLGGAEELAHQQDPLAGVHLL